MELLYIGWSMASFVLILAGAVLLFMILPKLRKSLEEDMTDIGITLLMQLVYSIEQTHKELDGFQKKDMARTRGKEIIEKYTLCMQDEELELFIEGEVYKMKYCSRS